MEQRGVVIKTDKEYAFVKIRRETSCGSSCAQCAGCELKEISIRAKNSIGAKPGDQVRLETETGSLLFAAFLVYLLPLLLGFLCGILLQSILLNSLLSVSIGIFVFVVTYLLIYQYNKKIAKTDRYISNITGIFD